MTLDPNTVNRIKAEALREAAADINTMQFGPAAAPYLSAIKAKIRADADEMEHDDAD